MVFSGTVIYGERHGVIGDSNARPALRFERHVTRRPGKDLNLLVPLFDTLWLCSEPFLELQTPQTPPAGRSGHNSWCSMRRGSCY